MREVIRKFDEFLTENGMLFTATVIGGAALNIMDITSRQTKDVDLIDPEIPSEILQLASEFVTQFPHLGLSENWLNNGPISIVRDLPKNWRMNTQLIYQGQSLKLYSLGRLDLLRTKLYALCDRGIDFDDCVKLAPTKAEIDECLPWVLQGDANPQWPERVKEMIETLKLRLSIYEK